MKICQMINKKVKHYEIRKKLGEGGMGVVYQAYDSKLDRIVAIKFLPGNLSDDDDRKKRFLNEARAASALQHNNTCTIFEIDESEKGQMYIVMPEYEGASLDQIMEKYKLSIKQVIEIAIQIGEGLKAAHKKGIIHRDIKSSNIFITADNQAIIMDFGLAKRNESVKLTKTGENPGTLPYMSPEQTKGEDIDYRSDIWSFGVLLYEMLAGQLPFKSDYPHALIYSILNEKPEILTKHNEEVSAELSSIVDKALQKSRHERWQNIDEMLQRLKGLKNNFNVRSKKEKTAGSEIVNRFRNWNISPVQLIVFIISLGFVVTAGYVLYTSGSGSVNTVSDATIAVLPFESLGKVENSTFTKAIHTGLMTKLSNVSGLKVTSRTSTLQYAQNVKSVTEIGRELNVDWIVRGEVQESADRVQVDARLVYAPEDRQIWAQNYHRVLTANNLFEIQSDLALEITTELETRISPAEKTRMERIPTSEINAYRNFTIGFGLLEQRTPETVLHSVNYFMEAIEEDSTYALAWAVLGEALIYIDFYKYDSIENYNIKPQEAIQKAININPDLAESHASLGILYYTRKMGNKAVEELQKAIELQPSLENAHNWLGFLYLLTGQPEKALFHAKRTIELNPLAPASRLYPSLSFLANGQPERALNEVKRAREIQPEWGEIYAYEGVMLHHNKQYANALDVLMKADSLIGGEIKSVWLPDIAKMANLSARAMDLTEMPASKMKANAMKADPFWTGMEYAAMDQHDRAIKSFKEINQFNMWINLSFRYYFEDELGPLKNNPEYRQIIDKLNKQWE